MTDDAILAVLKSIQTTLAEHGITLVQVRSVSVQQDVRDIRAAVSDMERTASLSAKPTPFTSIKSLTRNSDCACGEGRGS